VSIDDSEEHALPVMSAVDHASSIPRIAALKPVEGIATGARFRASADVTPLRPSCGACALRNVCAPAGLAPAETQRFESCVRARRKVAAGQHLYRAGEIAGALYGIRAGFVKTSIVTDDGREQVTGFHMMGEVIGIDAIGGGQRQGDAVALEDTEICEIPFAAIEGLARDVPALQRNLYQLMIQEIHQERETMLLLGTMRAEERVASFLLGLGRRYQARGYSALRFVLRMTRADIGSYLGLRLETVSRLLSRLQADRLLRVDSRSLEILDVDRLKLMIGRGV
jgi:CRP/FNR family transcriptional regulator